jgi:hypothetical protein
LPSGAEDIHLEREQASHAQNNHDRVRKRYLEGREGGWEAGKEEGESSSISSGYAIQLPVGTPIHLQANSSDADLLILSLGQDHQMTTCYLLCSLFVIKGETALINKNMLLGS